jgi:glycerophosphoryl diester phosphodiesterase
MKSSEVEVPGHTMPLLQTIEPYFLRFVDAVFARLPKKTPPPEALRACRIVSHRGEYDNRTVFENTLAAFEPLAARGVWGIECDLRWTRDFVPVVCHDLDLVRVFGRNERIDRMTFSRLRSTVPAVPSLEELVSRFGRCFHIMLEIKAEPYPDMALQNRRLEEAFAGLVPGRDYHLMSLSPEMFHKVPFVPAPALVPIAQTAVERFSRLALERGYAGLSGHYSFISRRRIRRHHRHGQAVGTGFANSVNVLFREIHRGVDWIFSDRAAAIQGMIREAIT